MNKQEFKKKYRESALKNMEEYADDWANNVHFQKAYELSQCSFGYSLFRKVGGKYDLFEYETDFNFQRFCEMYLDIELDRNRPSEMRHINLVAMEYFIGLLNPNQLDVFVCDSYAPSLKECQTKERERTMGLVNITLVSHSYCHFDKAVIDFLHSLIGLDEKDAMIKMKEYINEREKIEKPNRVLPKY